MEMAPGDVPVNWAYTTLLKALTRHCPHTDICEWVAFFVA